MTTRSVMTVTLTLMTYTSVMHAQAAPAEGWTFNGQVTSVWTAGNSEARTLGLASTLRRAGGRHDFKFETGGIRTESSRKTRKAFGTSETFRVEKEEARERTAETYFARARYDRTLKSGLVAFVGGDVLRNTFAGIDRRILLAAGAGNVWFDHERFHFATNYGVTYTFQNDVIVDPFFKSSFPGARVSWDLRRTLTATTQLESDMTSDLNFSNTNDVRVELLTSVAVSVNRILSLKPSLQLSWRNQPALTSIELFSAAGTSSGTSVSVPLEKLDTFFTLALVLTL